MTAASPPGGTGPATYVQVFGGLRLRRGDMAGDEAGDVADSAGSPQQQLLLAALLAAGGHAVSIEDLVAVLWAGRSPASAVNQIHRLVGRLRRDLEPGLAPRAAGSWLRAAGAGYRLTVPPGRSDLQRFRALVTQARRSTGPDGLRRWLDALELAPAPAFAGLPPRVLERSEFAAIQQERRVAAADAADAALALGRAADLLDPVRTLAGEAPRDERLQARTVRLLVATGRRADAVAHYDEVCRRLADELGVDPGRELRDAGREALGRPARPVLNQLPAPIPAFTDRDGGLAALGEQLDADPTGTVVVTAVAGMAGVGKTALAVQWAHSVTDRFPDGQLFLNLRGFDPAGRTVTPSQALSSLCRALEVPLGDLPEDAVDARSARFRAALAGRRVLLLLDNARDPDHVRPLLPGAPGCLALVTSRNRMSGLVVREGARSVPLGRLSTAEGARLLTDRLGARRVTAEPAAAGAIVEACAGLPLALAIAAARAATNPRLSLADVAAELTSAQLDALVTDDGLDDVRATFGLSYEALSPAAARLFRLLAAHPGSEIPVAAAGSVAGVPVDVARRLAAELLTASMLGEASPGRYTVHDLLQLYAAELLDAAGERADAERRLVHHYAAATRAAYLTYGRPPVGDLEATDDPLCPESFDGMAAALRWFAAERTVLAAVLDLAVAHGLDRSAATIALDWRPMSQSIAGHDDLHPHVLAGLAAAHRTGDLRLQGDLERDVAAISGRSGTPEGAALARQHFTRALTVFGTLGDPVGEAHTLRNLARFLLDDRDLDAAERVCRRAVELARQGDQPDAVVLSLWNLGTVRYEQDRFAEAAELLTEAMAVRLAGDPARTAPDIAVVLAQCLLNLDRPADAIHVLDRHLTDGVEAGYGEPELELYVLAVLAAAAARTGDTGRARDACLRYAALRRDSLALLVVRPTDRRWFAVRQQYVLDVAADLGLALDLPPAP